MGGLVKCSLAAAFFGPITMGNVDDMTPRPSPPPAVILNTAPPADTAHLMQEPRRRRPRSSKKKTGRPTTVEKSSAMRDRTRQAIADNDLELAATLLSEGEKVRNRKERSAWRLVRAEYECARKRYADAGLAAMHVVVFDHETGFAGNALYWVAVAYEGLNRPDKAASLYRECAEHEDTTKPVHELAQARLTALTPPATRS